MTIRELIHWDRPSNVSVREGNLGESMASLQEEMNRLFSHFYNGSLARLTDWDVKTAATPAVNVTENGKSFSVKVELAGMKPEDVEVEMTEGYLTIKGEKEEESK